MTLPSSIYRVIVCFCLFAGILAASGDKQVTVYSWPTAETSPQELAKISYNADTLFTAVTNYNRPKGAAKTDLIRIGLYDPKTSEWRGVVAGADSFDAEYQQKIELHVDEDSNVWHVGFAAYPKPQPINSKNSKPKSKSPEVPQVVVEIVKTSLGPVPHLNKPVLLDAEGKVADKEPEKTFLQKYWWAIGLFILIQLVMGGGGGGDK